MKRNRKIKLKSVTPLLLGILLFTVNISSVENINLPDCNRMKPGHLPTPFSAEEIRTFNQGRTVKYLIETAGKKNSFTKFTFRKGDMNESDYDIFILDSNEKQVGPKNKMQTKWTELQAHASFPETNTTVKYNKKSTEIGTFDCWVYTSIKTKDSKKNINQIWFARSMPGPPILVIHKTNGKIVFKMTMIKTSKK